MTDAPRAWVPESSMELKGRDMLLVGDDLLKLGNWLRPPLSAAELLSEAIGRHRSRDAMLQDISDGVPETTHSVPRRFQSGLKGGDVPRCCPSDPLAIELLRRGLPVVLMNGAMFPAGTAASSWTAETLIARLQGTEQAALVAPPACARRFAFYNRRNHVGDYEASAFFRPVDGEGEGEPAISAAMLAVDIDEAFAEERHGGPLTEAELAERLPRLSEAPPAKYLQMRIFHRSEGQFDACELPAPLLRELKSSIDFERLRSLMQLGGFGGLVVSQCFVAPRNALSPCHYDDQHNVFCQLAGRKSFLIFAPDHAMPHLAPYPTHHCADRRARADCENSRAAAAVQGTRGCLPGDASFKALRGTAVEAVLEPGDTLILPAHWWHHVQALGEGSVSISFWMMRVMALRKAVEMASSDARSSAHESGDAGVLGAGKRIAADDDESRHDGCGADASVWRELRMRLAREVETALGMEIGPENVRAFLLRLGGRVRGIEPANSSCEAKMGYPCEAKMGYPCEAKMGYPCEGRSAEGCDGSATGVEHPVKQRPLLIETRLQQWLISRLGTLLGTDAVEPFLHDYLGERRFADLR